MDTRRRTIRSGFPALFLGACLVAGGAARGQDSISRAYNPNLTAGSGVRAMQRSEALSNFNAGRGAFPFNNGFNPAFQGGFNQGFSNGFAVGNVAPVGFAVPGYSGNAFIGLPTFGGTFGQNVTGFGVTNYSSFTQQYGSFGIPTQRAFGKSTRSVQGGFFGGRR